MRKNIEAWETAAIAQTCESEYAISHICTDDLICGELAERQRDKISRLAYGILYRQAVRELEEKQSTL